MGVGFSQSAVVRHGFFRWRLAASGWLSDSC